MHLTRKALVGLLSATGFAVATFIAAVEVVPSNDVVAAIRELSTRTPMELVRYAERRLIGHPRLETLVSPALVLVRSVEERGAPGLPLPDLGKGQRPKGLTAARYDASGRPVAALPLSREVMETSAIRTIRDINDLRQALASAKAGDILELAPGTYQVTSALRTAAGGSPRQPIVLRARRAGTALFEVRAVEGFVVSHPYWVFENLNWRGVCADHSGCEHAFHVVGPARGTIIRNNRLEDFNAHIKVNGEGGQWPDEGLLQYSTLTNAMPRQTENPVTPFDLVAASGWQVLDNLVENFIRANDSPTYGIFMKGASQGGLIARNLVICSRNKAPDPGIRVGISLGGGGTGTTFCRDGACAFEHSNGTVANNVVAHCNDFGIDVARSTKSTIAFNTLINTEGIDLRRPPSSAVVFGNLTDGRIRQRDGTDLQADDNLIKRGLDALLAGPDRLDLRWLSTPPWVTNRPAVPTDFCGRTRGPLSPVGATVDPDCL